MPPEVVHHKSYPFYGFRLWHGMTACVWFRIMARNRFAVSPSRVPLVLLGAVYSILNSVLRTFQVLIFAKRIRACILEQPPIFIIGHWRTGTTYLHELLALDEAFTAPTTLECLAPAQCLASSWLLRKLSFLLPTTRPMDNMSVGWDYPQEDELALLNLGLGSPYEALVFPNHRRIGHKFLNLSEVAPEQAEAWKAGLLAFLQQVNFRSTRGQNHSDEAKRIVLKSPPHTARLHVLRRMFPAAQFIHIVRQPYDVFASTVRLWHSLYDTQGCQEPDYGSLSNGAPAIEQYVLETMNLLYRDFFAQVSEIPAKAFCQVRYEDLVRAPVAEMRRIYEHLGIGSFERIRPKLEAHLRMLEGYKPNEFRISDERKEEVSRHWGWYMDRFGYRVPSSAA